MLSYRNAPMSHAEATDIRIDVGQLLSDIDGRGRLVPGTTRVEAVPNGKGYDLIIPAEHVAQMVATIKARLPLLGIADPTAAEAR